MSRLIPIVVFAALGVLSGLPTAPGGLPDEEYTPGGVTVFGSNNGFTTAEQFAADKDDFEEVQTPEMGLGPIFNNDSCVACHHHPVTGGGSVITVLRAGKTVAGKFIEHPGGSIIHARATDPSIVEHVFAGYDQHGQRISPPLFGLGLVEAIDTNDITAYRDTQPIEMRGEVVTVPSLEAPLTTRAGRFGLKCQHGSVLSFAADANRNEIGRTSKLMPDENTSNGKDVSALDRGPKPNDGGDGFGTDVEAYTRFIRSLAAPPPDAAIQATPDAQTGLKLFRSLGCAICHREQYTTVAPGTRLNGGLFVVDEALGSKTIRPFSDFLVHDVGTGDGIVQGGPQSTANKFRTTPLWGLRAKNRLMHNGQALTRHDAILRHAGEAKAVTDKYKALTQHEQELLILFLRSL